MPLRSPWIPSARDSVRRISALQLGQVIVGSFMRSFWPVAKRGVCAIPDSARGMRSQSGGRGLRGEMVAAARGVGRRRLAGLAMGADCTVSDPSMKNTERRFARFVKEA